RPLAQGPVRPFLAIPRALNSFAAPYLPLKRIGAACRFEAMRRHVYLPWTRVSSWKWSAARLPSTRTGNVRRVPVSLASRGDTTRTASGGAPVGLPGALID